MAASILRPFALILVAAGLALATAGCSVIGYTAGSEADERHPGTPVALE